jgi:hypothetical protein
MRTLILGLAALTMAVPALTAAVAGKNEQRDEYDRYYDTDGYYSGPTWRGEDGRTYCRRRDGTAGLVIGAAAGALIGRAIDSHGNRGTGTIVGGALGALVGREAARNRCQ